MPSPYAVSIPTKSKQMKPRVVILAPGAGGSKETPVLVELAKNLSSKGVMVVRFDFPYRMAGKKAPDSPKILTQAWQEALEYSVKKCATELTRRDLKFKQINVSIGGRSMGGRVASLLAQNRGNEPFELPAINITVQITPIAIPIKPSTIPVMACPEPTPVSAAFFLPRKPKITAGIPAK